MMKDKEDITSIMKLIDELEDRLFSLAPEKYKGALRHFIKARLEVLRGIEELIRIRREELEKRLEESRKPKREKVSVE